MGMLDFLIDKDNGKPKQDMEYIYRLDIVWRPNELGSEEIKVGTIMTDVIQLPNRSYQFKNKETGDILRTNYAWALAENTPENIIKIEKYEEEYKKFQQHEQLIKLLRSDIVTLKPIK